MYSSSAALTNRLFSGGVYMNTQNPIQMKPNTPMITNDNSQPQYLASNGIVNGAAKAPIEAPALKIEVANARSRFGKYSAVTLTAAGKYPASPIANTQRAAKKKYILKVAIMTAISPVAIINCVQSSSPTQASVATPQKACRQAPNDHTPIDHKKPAFVPIQSITRPANNIPIAYTIEKVAVIRP